jgi:alpha-methylacyl-CoA racemase
MIFQPLRDVRVLDFSRLLPGPYCSYILSRMGARVTVIEHPTEAEVLTFPVVQQGKKRLKIDLKTSSGLKEIKDLVKKSDVVLEGFRPGVMERLGLSFQKLRRIHPKLIFCSLSGYGQKEPRKAGHDLNYLSLSGMISSLAAGRPPQIPGVPMADLVGGMKAALQILAALVVPLKSRRAVHLDVSICDAASELLIPLSSDVSEAIRPIFSGGLARYHLYEAKDGKWLAVAPLEEKFWMKFVESIGIPSSVLSQGESKTVFWLKEKFREKDRTAWLNELTDPDLCVTPVL